MSSWSRACSVCHEQCSNEGQLCDTCVAAGHRIENDNVIFNFEIRVPWEDNA